MERARARARARVLGVVPRGGGWRHLVALLEAEGLEHEAPGEDLHGAIADRAGVERELAQGGGTAERDPRQHLVVGVGTAREVKLLEPAPVACQAAAAHTGLSLILMVCPPAHSSQWSSRSAYAPMSALSSLEASADRRWCI